ncbi:lipoprotein 17-related variable surface protein [Mycoplasma sp. ATU-Cv-508]|uniref:lipoprotein 17-related variable surface protein n=1 Tax=Mycoplasma sp. ATU-Cv-508 TaxID=2048001 RepID=UPI000FDE5ED5
MLITISVGKAQLEANLLIQGYATNKQISDELRRQTNQELQDLLNYIRRNRDRTVFDQKLPSQVGEPQETTNFEKLGLQEIDEETQTGIAIQLRINWVSDQNGEIGLEVSLSKNNQSLNDRLVVRGYKKIAQVIKEQQEKIAEELKSLVEWISQNLVSTSNNSERPSQIGSENAPVTLNRLGVQSIPEEKRNGASISFEIVNTDDFEGNLEVKVTASKEDQSRSKNFVITGYKTHDQEMGELLEWIVINRGRTSLRDKLPSEIAAGKTLVSFKELGLHDLPKNLFGEYEIEMVIDQANDNDGTLEISLTIRKDTKQATHKREIKWKIKGYKTNDEVLNILTAKIKWIEDNRGLSAHRDKMPSSIGRPGQKIDFKALGIGDFKEISDQGINFEIVFVSADDAKGEVKIKVTLSHRGVSHESEIAIRGYRKILDQLAQVIDLIQSRGSLTRKSGKLPSQIGQEDQIVSFDDLGLDDLTKQQKQGAEIILTILGLSDRRGTVKVKVEVRKESESISSEITVSGFKTTEDQIKEVKKQVQELSEWIDNNWSNTSLSDKLPTKVGVLYQEVDAKHLGLKQLPQTFGEIFELAIRIERFDDQQGEISVKITITNSNIQTEKMLVIKGYKRVGVVESQLNLVFDWIGKNWTQTSKSDIIPSEIAALKQEIDYQKLGLINLPDSFVKNTEMKCIVEKIDDLTGQVVIRVELTREGVKASRSFTIAGFKKVSDQLNELLALIKQRLQTLKVNDKVADHFGKEGSFLTLSSLDLLDLNLRKAIVKILVEAVDIENGKLTITLELSKQGVVKKETLTLKGFLKKSDLDIQTIAEMVKQILELNKADDVRNIKIKIDPKSRYFDIDFEKITAELIEDDALGWKIVMPPKHTKRYQT